MTYLRAAALAALLTVAPVIVQATPVTLNFDGTITSATNLTADTPPGIVAGATFRLTVSYDSAAAQLNPCIGGPFGGCAGAYNASTLSVSLLLDPGCAPCEPGVTDAAISRILVFNNFDGSNDATANPVDGLSFVLIDTGRTRWSINLFSPDTTTYSGVTLPGTLDTRLSAGTLQVCSILPVATPPTGALAFTTFSPCDNNDGIVNANLVASVPEPATLALLGLALTGVAVRRRKLALR